MKIALVQGRIRSDRPAENLEFIKNTLAREDLAAADLVIFPALALSGRLGPVTRDRPGLDIQYQHVWEKFLKISADRPQPVIVFSRLMVAGDRPAAEQVAAVQGGREMELFESGGVVCFQLAGWKVGLWVGGSVPPDAAGHVDMLITLHDRQYQGRPYVPPLTPGSARAWRLNVSAVGAEGPCILDGATWVFDPAGQLKGWAHGFEPAMIILDTEARHLPTLEPRPVREPLEVLRQALVGGLADFVGSTGCPKVVLGLSGGLDSALVAVLAVDALGPENVLGVAMPSEYNAPESLHLARELAKNLGISFLTIPIDALRGAFGRSFPPAPEAGEKARALADENVQARIRGVLLMYLANSEGRLVLATANKSEAAMGYSTLYGDTCGAIAPIGDLYKVQVFKLARYLNREQERIPQGIINRPPSAELRPGQRDDDSLPPYDVLDDILMRHLEGRQSGSQAATEGGHSALTVAWVLGTLKKTAYKRAQEPFSLCVSAYPLSGYDW